MTPKQKQIRHDRIKAAMVSLVSNPNFTQFMEVLRNQREVAIEDICNDAVLANQRTTMAAAGEIRALKNIIDIYDEASSAEATQEDSEP